MSGFGPHLQWNLPLVLFFFKEAPFEHLKEASLEDFKTIFLIVWASERCRSEVHSFLGLPSAVVFTATQDWVTFVVLPVFVTKTVSSPLVKIPTLMTCEGTFDSDYTL